MRQFLPLLLLAIAIGCGGEDETWRAQLSDPDPGVRRAAVRDLASTVETTKAIPMLTAALQDTDEKVQVAAALVLLRVDSGSLDYRPVVERALRGGQGPVFVALGATGKMGTWAVPTLIALLKDRHATIRALAAKTLGEIGAGSEEVDAALQRGLRDENSSVRNACQHALDRLRTGDTTPSLQ